MTSGQETERVYSYNPGARTGNMVAEIKLSITSSQRYKWDDLPCSWANCLCNCLDAACRCRSSVYVSDIGFVCKRLCTRSNLSICLHCSLHKVAWDS